MVQGKILEQLWFAHASMRVTEWTKEAEKLMDELDEREEALFANLSDEQQHALDEYKTSFHELRTLFEKDAFMKGVQFATAYMIEALGQPNNR